MIMEKLYLELAKLGVANPCAIATAMSILDLASLTRCLIATDETEAQFARNELLRLAGEAADLIKH